MNPNEEEEAVTEEEIRLMVDIGEKGAIEAAERRDDRKHLLGLTIPRPKML